MTVLPEQLRHSVVVAHGGQPGANYSLSLLARVRAMGSKSRNRPTGGQRPTRSRLAPRRSGVGLSQVAVAGALVAAAVALVAIAVAGRGGSGGSESANQLALAEGAPAPPVALPATTGETVDVAGFRGKQAVLLYFYEHAG
jgi:hypothetical protein